MLRVVYVNGVPKECIFLCLPHPELQQVSYGSYQSPIGIYLGASSTALGASFGN